MRGLLILIGLSVAVCAGQRVSTLLTGQNRAEREDQAESARSVVSNPLIEGDEISILGERVVEGVSEGSGLLHKSTFGIDRSGKRVQVYFQSDEIRPGRFLTASARVFGVDDRGRVWVKMDQIGQTGLSTEHVSSIGPKKLVAYRVTYTGEKACGSPEAPADCVAPCSLDEMYGHFMNGPKSMSRMLEATSGGVFKLTADRADWKEFSVPAGTNVDDLSDLAEQKFGASHKNAAFHFFYIPKNYGRDKFVGSRAAAKAVLNGDAWFRECSVMAMPHELGHTLGLGHAGKFTSSGRFSSYVDPLSFMSEELNFVGPWRGLHSNQLAQMGWLEQKDILDITKDGEYKIKSLSAGVGQRAARIRIPGQEDVFIEWRSEEGMDLDLTRVDMYLQPRDTKAYKSLVIITNDYPEGRLPQTALLAVINQGASQTLSKHGLTFFADRSVPGKFLVEGVVAPAASAPRVMSSAAPVSGDTLCPRSNLIRLFSKPARETFAGMATESETFKWFKTYGTDTYMVKRCTGGLFLWVASKDVYPCDKPCSTS